jgi:hypothetical protein
MAPYGAILKAAQVAITFNSASFPTGYGAEYASSTLITWTKTQGIAPT